MTQHKSKDVRRQQLILATMASIAQHGLHNTTIVTISNHAGMSSGIISHYFGGKQGLINATVRHLFDQLKQALLSRLSQGSLSPRERLLMIVEANFTQVQRSLPATKTWISFWEQSMHEPVLARLQRVNHRRLHSNLSHGFGLLMPRHQARQLASQTAAMIDGFWLRSALSPDPQQAFSQAEVLCKAFIENLLMQYGENGCPKQ
ncbi:transcriptional regulator BetI [Ferrimonas kyonanensis]|uniref:transcriptional regulator BetI n=1 Tax=Ferrimonas kyonanensis TaxID=364763 RepID=UPI000483B13D|nr:transcriptional regulator BetI [Ferrimonas kyonanensis]